MMSRVHELTLNQAVEKMRGPVHTKLKLTIMRKGQGQADRRDHCARRHSREVGALTQRGRRCRLYPYHPTFNEPDHGRLEEGDP